MIDGARALAGVLAETPYAHRLGLRLEGVDEEGADLWLPWTPELANAGGVAHGGVAASLAAWAAMTAAVSSDRGDARSARLLSASISFLSPARDEPIHASARVASRGRDVVHATCAVTGLGGRPVASALFALQALGEAPIATPRLGVPAAAEGPLVSPFAQGLGLDFRAAGDDGAELAMRCAGNQGLGGTVDPGALLAVVDTCAAVACMPGPIERRRRSHTLTLSAVFGPPCAAEAVARGRCVTGDSVLRSAHVEAGAPGAPPSVVACVAFRFPPASAEAA